MPDFHASYRRKVYGIRPVSQLASFWQMDEVSGTALYDATGNSGPGTYTNPQIGKKGIKNGRSSAYFDGSTTIAQLATSIPNFPGQEGSAGLFVRALRPESWTDGIVRRFLTIQVDANNRLILQRTATAYTINFFYQAGATLENLSVVSPIRTTDWLHLACTWSKSNDRFLCYINGQQVASSTGLGTFAGTPVVNYVGSVGAGSYWEGYIDNLWVFSSELTAAEIGRLAEQE